MRDVLLTKLHRAMVTQACLSNLTAIFFLLHVRHLARQLQASLGDLDGVGELLSASSQLASLMKEQATAMGCTLG